MHFYKLYGIEFLSLVEKSKFHPITFSCFKMKTVYLQVKIFFNEPVHKTDLFAN